MSSASPRSSALYSPTNPARFPPSLSCAWECQLLVGRRWAIAPSALTIHPARLLSPTRIRAAENLNPVKMNLQHLAQRSLDLCNSIITDPPCWTVSVLHMFFIRLQRTNKRGQVKHMICIIYILFKVVEMLYAADQNHEGKCLTYWPHSLIHLK